MKTWRWMITTLGGAGIAIIVATTVLAAVLAALLAPRLVSGSERAEARVSMAQITGARASYELATYVADFQSVTSSARVQEAVAAATGIPVTDVAAAASTERQGDSTTVRVTFDASSPTAAEAGLRTLAAEALSIMVDDARSRAGIELAAVRAQQEILLDRLAETGATDEAIPAEFRDMARDQRLQRAVTEVANAELELAIVDAEANAVPEYASSLNVSVSSLPRTSMIVRAVLAAATTSFVLAAMGVLVARRRGMMQAAPTDRETEAEPSHPDVPAGDPEQAARTRRSAGQTDAG